MDITLYGDEMVEAFRLYLKNKGLRSTGETALTLRDDEGKGLRLEIKGVEIFVEEPPRKEPAIVERPVERPVESSAPQQTKVSNARVKPRANTVTLIDASSYKPGQLEETETFEMDASRFDPGPPPPKGDPPTVRKGTMTRVAPHQRDEAPQDEIPEEYRVKPAEGLAALHALERGRF